MWGWRGWHVLSVGVEGVACFECGGGGVEACFECGGGGVEACFECGGGGGGMF